MFKLALVTGATSGLGEALCALLSEKKIPLILSGRNAKRLKENAELYGAEAFALDLRSSREPLLEWMREHKPDLIINNAGFTLYGPALIHSTRTQMEILEVNAAAAVEISIEAARTLALDKRRGVILNVSSAAGELPMPSLALYAAAKSLLTAFSQSFDAEMRPYGIRILASLPGPIATPFAEKASQGLFTQHPSWSILTPRQTAEKIWKQIETQKGVEIIDFRTRVALGLAKLSPRFLVEWILKKNLSKRYPSMPST